MRRGADLCRRLITEIRIPLGRPGRARKSSGRENDYPNGSPALHGLPPLKPRSARPYIASAPWQVRSGCDSARFLLCLETSVRRQGFRLPGALGLATRSRMVSRAVSASDPGRRKRRCGSSGRGGGGDRRGGRLTWRAWRRQLAVRVAHPVRAQADTARVKNALHSGQGGTRHDDEEENEHATKGRDLAPTARTARCNSARALAGVFKVGAEVGRVAARATNNALDAAGRVTAGAGQAAAKIVPPEVPPDKTKPETMTGRRAKTKPPAKAVRKPPGRSGARRKVPDRRRKTG